MEIPIEVRDPMAWARPDYQIEKEIEKTNEELRNEWLQWIDERSKQYLIEPIIINRLSKTPDVYVYTTPYGVLEFAEKVVENYITKPVDTIINSRARRDLILFTESSAKVPKRSILINPRTSPVKQLKKLSFNWKCHYTELCEDMYETYDERMADFDFLPKHPKLMGFRMSNGKLISFDDNTGELCLKMYTSVSKAGRLKFNLGIAKSRQKEIIHFVDRGFQRHQSDDGYKNSSELVRELCDSLKLLNGYQNLTWSFFRENHLEIPKDSTLFLNRNLTNLAKPFMKKIRQTLINICCFLKIQVSGELAVNCVVYQAGSPNKIFLSIITYES